MGFFNSPEKRMLQMQQKQMDINSSQGDLGVFQQIQEQGFQNFSLEPQVSGMLLKPGEYFLPWQFDPVENNKLRLPKEYEYYEEPGGSEPFSFLNEKAGDRELLADFSHNLVSILQFQKKYGHSANGILAFNKIGSIRKHYMSDTRALEGKAQQLAKSQIIKSTGQITRYNDPKQKQEKLFGLF